MTKLTINVPDDIIQKLEEQHQPLQTLLLQALNDYLQKSPTMDTKARNSVKTQTGELGIEYEIQKLTSDGRRMADALNQIAATSSLTGLDPITWQKDIRSDRPLPDRD